MEGQNPDDIKNEDEVSADKKMSDVKDEDAESVVRKGRGRPKGKKVRPVAVARKRRSCRVTSVPKELIIPAPTRGLKHLSYDWTLEERKKLLLAIKIYNYTNTAALSKYIGSKSEEEIEWFINNLKRRRIFAEKKDTSEIKSAPIESWLRTCEDLVRDMTDHSQILPSVISVAGDLEPHHVPYDPTKDPDYTKIYDYIAHLLRGDPTPELSPIDSAVVLDLLQNTVDILRVTDVSQEREMMKRKFVLLNTKGDKTMNIVKKALKSELEEDPTEPDVDQIRAQVNAMRNRNFANPEEQDTMDISDEPSTSGAGENNSYGEVLEASSQNLDNNNDSLLDNIDHSRPEFFRIPRTRIGRVSNTNKNSRLRTSPKYDGLKAGRLVSINPFCIDVKYLKLSNTQKAPQAENVQ